MRKSASAFSLFTPPPITRGGRAEESGRATIDALPEVVDAVDGRIPVLVDGGVKRHPVSRSWETPILAHPILVKRT